MADIAEDTTVPFISMDVKNNHWQQHVHASNTFSKFKWLNKLILWFGMWVFKTPQQTYRPKWVNYGGMFVVTICVLYNIYYFAYNKYANDLWEIYTALRLVIASVGDVCLITSKILSIWYYWKTFNFALLSPTSNSIYSLVDSSSNDFVELCQHKITKTNKRMIMFLSCYAVTCFFHYGAEFYRYSADHMFGDIMWIITYFYCFLIPIAISQCCASVIFLHFELSVHKLINILCVDKSDAINIDYDSITKHYKTTLQEFQKESTFWTWYFSIKFLGLFCFIWVYSSVLIHSINSIYGVIFCVVGIAFWMTPFVELVAASSNLSSAYHRFCCELLVAQSNINNQSTFDELNKSTIYKVLRATQKCNYLYNYVCANELYFKLFGSELHVKAATRLIMLFCCAKLISYSIYNI